MIKIFSFTIAAIGLVLVPAAAIGDEIFAYLRNGSSVKIGTLPLLTWSDLDQTAPQANETIDWENIQEIRLTDAEIDDQAKEIARLLQQLSNDSYHLREQAEAKLSSSQDSGGFIRMIEQFGKSTDDAEVIYRVSRILRAIADSDDSYGARFDEMIMIDGTVRTGNVLNFRLPIEYKGKRIQLDRAAVQNLHRHHIVKTASKPKPVNTVAHNRLGHKNFYNDRLHIIESFETDRFGNLLNIGARADRLFAHNGLLFDTEQPGHFKVLKYNFKFCPIGVGSRCVCPYDDESELRLRGITEVTFCLPDQPRVAAGVKEVGLFLERIEHSRDVVVEAYNVHGQMLAMVEATDGVCVFAGFESNQLITKLRILRNPDLPDLDRSIDNSYAFDMFTLEKPVAIPQLARQPENGSTIAARIQLTTGQSYLVESCQFSSQSVQFTHPLTGEADELSWDAVRSVAFVNPDQNKNLPRPDAQTNGHLTVQTANGSIVQTVASNYLSAADFVGEQFNADQLRGVWHQTARLPETKDLQAEKPVIVYPSCRIVARDFAFEQKGFRWNKETSEKLVQQIHVPSNDDWSIPEEADPDLTPDVDSINFSNPMDDIPSLWLKPPVAASLNSPHLRLFDGQFFVLDGNSKFSLSKIDSQKRFVEISRGQASHQYSFDEIASISLAK